MTEAAFSRRISRVPVPHDDIPAADARRLFGDLAPDVVALLAGTAGGSPFLAGLMQREPDWLRRALAASPEAALAGLLEGLVREPPDVLARSLRRAKGRLSLLVALADLGGVWELEQVTGALTAFADRAVQLALEALVEAEVRRGRLAGQTEDDIASGAGMVVLAMGKMGAGELNYSSDIDLICLFDETRYGTDAGDARTVFVRLTRRLAGLMSDVTADGYVFRTDLRLRPDAAVTPVCLSMGAAESYYESEGRTWERAAYIKARACAGDIAAGARFLAALRPFVWRKHLDFVAIQDAHDMRLRIREHRGLHGRIVLEGHNMKLGAGGIREIEFFAQTRQLIAGGRDPALRDRQTVPALAALAARGWVPEAVSNALAGTYRAHREVEHRLQMVADAQTHSLPVTAGGIARIAHLCGESDVAAWRDRLLERLEATDRLTEGFFAPQASAAGPALSTHAASVVERWVSYPAMRSDRAQAIFRRLKPGLLRKLQAAVDPDEALASFDGFLAGLPAGVQLFALFEANPQLVELIVDVLATAPVLGRYLARNAQVLDAVIGGSFFAPWPGRSGLEAGLRQAMAGTADYEAKLDAARAWMREWHFRVGVHHLRGLTDAFVAGAQYADLARAVVAAVWPVAVAEVVLRHGPPPGRGAVVLGMGSLGAGLLNAGSDLDLIVIYDADAVDMSAGPRPLASRAYYARLTQGLVTALAAPMAAGRLYEVDMRLRPSGRQGPVATAVSSFRTYQMEAAWTWEHLALTRARVLAGEPLLAAEVEALRQDVLATTGTGAQVLGDVADMRRRLAEAKPGTGGLEVKAGPGRLMDIELFAQTMALTTGSPARAVAEQIAAGVDGQKVSQTDATVLLEAHRLFWAVQAGVRLLTSGAAEAQRLAPEKLGTGARAFLARQTGGAEPEALVNAAAVRAAAVIERLIGGTG